MHSDDSLDAITQTEAKSQMLRTNSRKFRRLTLFSRIQTSVLTTIDSVMTVLLGIPLEASLEADSTSILRISSVEISFRDSLVVVVVAAENVVALIFLFVTASNWPRS